MRDETASHSEEDLRAFEEKLDFILWAVDEAFSAVLLEAPFLVAQVFLSTVRAALRGLQECIDNPELHEVTWASPMVTLPCPAGKFQVSHSPHHTCGELSAEDLRGFEVPGEETTPWEIFQGLPDKLRLHVESMLAQGLTCEALGAITNRVVIEKHGEKHGVRLPLDLENTVDAMPAEERREAISRLSAPLIRGGRFADESGPPGDQAEEWEPSPDRDIDEDAHPRLSLVLEALDHMHLSGESEGQKAAIHFAIMVEPLLADVDTGQADYPVTVGIHTFGPDGEELPPELAEEFNRAAMPKFLDMLGLIAEFLDRATEDAATITSPLAQWLREGRPGIDQAELVPSQHLDIPSAWEFLDDGEGMLCVRPDVAAKIASQFLGREMSPDLVRLNMGRGKLAGGKLPGQRRHSRRVPLVPLLYANLGEWSPPSREGADWPAIVTELLAEHGWEGLREHLEAHCGEKPSSSTLSRWRSGIHPPGTSYRDALWAIQTQTEVAAQRTVRDTCESPDRI